RDMYLRLTGREREVLAVAAEGLTARQIATRLGVRERTVTTHLARIYGKLGVGNRLAAVRMAARSGLVTVGASEERQLRRTTQPTYGKRGIPLPAPSIYAPPGEVTPAGADLDGCGLRSWWRR